MVQLGLLVLLPYSALLVSLILFVFFLVVFFTHLQIKAAQNVLSRLPQSAPILPTVSLGITVPTNHKTISTETAVLESELATTLELLRAQPTHRDLLVNAALLNEALGNTDQAHFFLDQAKAIDPNHATFSPTLE